MVEVQLEPELEARLERLVANSHVTKSFLVHEAIEKFVEDREDYLAGIQSLSQTAYTSRKKRWSADRVWRIEYNDVAERAIHKNVQSIS